MNFNTELPSRRGSAITDIVFVSSLSSTPLGYTAIKYSFGGYGAQLYDNGFGFGRGQQLTSYLCFTTMPSRDDLVVENMYMHSKKEEPPRNGYQILKNTLEGNEALRRMKLAIKKVPRHEAKSIICDIAIYRNKDQGTIPDDYVPLAKVNHLRITFFLVSCDQSSHTLQSASSLLVDSQVQSSSEAVNPRRRRGFHIFKQLLSRRHPEVSPGPSSSILQSSSQSLQARKSEEKHAVPITDVIFVTSLDNVPRGYIAIEQCESGQSAQLWQPLMGGLPRRRYLCYTKERQKDDTVIESMYMLGYADQFITRGYSLIKETVEGDEPLRQRHLAIKKTSLSKAHSTVVDIVIYHIDDSGSIPVDYSVLEWSVNNLLICFLSAAQKNLQEEKRKKRFKRKELETDKI